MVRKVVLTCAVGGENNYNRAHPSFPVTPQQIANAAKEAEEAGASAVHLHVRDPATGNSSRNPDLLFEMATRVREAGVKAVMNISGDRCRTAGLGRRGCAGEQCGHWRANRRAGRHYAGSIERDAAGKPDYLCQRHVDIAGQVKQATDQHRAMARRQDEAVSVGPARRFGVKAQVFLKKHRYHIGHAHRNAGMHRSRGSQCQRADRGRPHLVIRVAGARVCDAHSNLPFKKDVHATYRIESLLRPAPQPNPP